MTELTIHGITFIRSGSCNRCGACGCEKMDCPHFSYAGRYATCDVYDTRNDMCEQCGISHDNCVGFPDNPWVRVVREGICGYTFNRKDGGSMDDLPFLNGESWFRGRG